MACAAVTTGKAFLSSTIGQIDCQAQAIGSLGYQSLASPGSSAVGVLSALLTLFVALFGIRLMFGGADRRSELVNAILRIGIVVTLAFSWPAWKTLAYDTVLYGPAEIAGAILPVSSDTGAGLVDRLQQIDTGIAALTYYGTGRQTGALPDNAPTSGFRAVALEDESGFGWSRPLFLASVIGSLATLRLAAGILLAIAPLMAGLLLFDFARGLFAGWIRGLALTALGSLALTVLFWVQLAVMEPWLADIFTRRSLGYATPSAPTELLALVLAFALATVGLLFVMARVAFHFVQPAFQALQQSAREAWTNPVARQSQAVPLLIAPQSRALMISESVTNTLRRESQGQGSSGPQRTIEMRPGAAATADARTTVLTAPLGSAHGRQAQTQRRTQTERDRRT